MQLDSPFGPKRSDAAASASTSLSEYARPAPRTAGQDVNSRRFAQLKPICVELLGCVGSASLSETHVSLHAILQKLSSKLRSLLVADKTTERIPLSLALISYVFFPVAQLLRTLSTPPDRIRCLLFRILADLAQDWWQAWTAAPDVQGATGGEASVRQQWKVWEQLLMLAAITLTPKPGQLTEHSEETTLAVLSLLNNVLSARTAKTGHTQSEELSARLDDWEWDGVTDLGDFDDYEREMEKLEQARLATASNSKTAKTNTDVVLVYPSSMHLLETYDSPTSRGVLAHVLTASLDLARSPQRPRQVRVESIHLARVVLHVWFAGLDFDLHGVEERIGHSVSQKAIEQAKRSATEFQRLPRAKRLMAFLPGVVSATVRICSEAKVHADVASQALQLMRVMLRVCLADETASRSVAAAPSRRQEDSKGVHDTLESLIAAAHISEAEGDGEAAEEGSDTPLVEISKDFGVSAASSNKSMTEPTPDQPSMAGDTMERVAVALLSISPLAAHDNTAVQTAIAELAGDVLLNCSEQFKEVSNGRVDVSKLLFGWLLDVAAREESKAAQFATSFIGRILNGQAGTDSFIAAEIVGLAQQMPRLLTSLGQDDSLYTAARRLRYLIRLASGAVDGAFTRFDDLRTLLEGQNGYERWAIGVIASISIDEASTTLLADVGTVRLWSLEARASRAVTDVFFELGAAAGRLCRAQTHANPLALAEHLMHLAMHWRRATTGTDTSRQGLRRRQMSVSALLLAKEVTAGVASILDDSQTALLPGTLGSRIRKQGRRFARSVMSQVVEMWQTDEEEMLQRDLCDSGARLPYTFSADELQLIRSQTDMPLALAAEYRRGVEGPATDHSSTGRGEETVQLGPAVKVDFVQAATISASQLQTTSKSSSGNPTSLTRQQRQKATFSQAYRSDALLLAIMASCGKVLGPAVKPMLLQTIYPTVCAVTSGSDVVRASAGAALEAIAHAAGYASVQGCLLDHADYVLGAASHRLVSTLGQELEARRASSNADDGAANAPVQSYSPLMSAMSAPLVLAELIRTLGKEVVVLVEDAIDEVLDAIDRFHGDQAICDALLSVLDRMLEAILEQAKIPGVDDDKGAQAQAGFEPNNRRDFDTFAQWYSSRKEKTPVETAEELLNEKQGVPNGFNDDDNEDVATSTTTRSQQVTLSMLKKAAPFLSHGSRTLRLRCLRLINRGVEVLCRQHLTAEPLSVVNTLWPMLMSRLGFSLSRVLPDVSGKGALPRASDLDEQDFFVAIEAVKLVSTLARYLVQYLGREKMLRQAIPRVLLLLRIVEHAEERPGDVRDKDVKGDQTTFLLRDRAAAGAPSTAVVHWAFRPIRRHSPLAILLGQAIVMLDTLVGAMGSSMSEADLFALAAHPTLLSCLDVRQYETLQELAHRLYFDTLNKRNAALVWFIVNATNARAGDFPVYLSRPELSLGVRPM